MKKHLLGLILILSLVGCRSTVVSVELVKFLGSAKDDKREIIVDNLVKNEKKDLNKYWVMFSECMNLNVELLLPDLEDNPIYLLCSEGLSYVELKSPQQQNKYLGMINIQSCKGAAIAIITTGKNHKTVISFVAISNEGKLTFLDALESEKSYKPLNIKVVKNTLTIIGTTKNNFNSKCKNYFRQMGISLRKRSR